MTTYEWGTIDMDGHVEPCSRYEGESLVHSAQRLGYDDGELLTLVRREVGPWEPVLSDAEQGASPM